MNSQPPIAEIQPTENRSKPANSQVVQKNQHGRVLSVNLPYASKQMIRTNMQWAQAGNIKTKSQLDSESAIANANRSSTGDICQDKGRKSEQTGARDSIGGSWQGSLDIKTQPSSTSDQITIAKNPSQLLQKPQPYPYTASDKQGCQDKSLGQQEEKPSMDKHVTIFEDIVEEGDKKILFDLHADQIRDQIAQLQDYGEESFTDTEEEIECSSILQGSRDSIQHLNDEIQRKAQNHSENQPNPCMMQVDSQPEDLSDNSEEELGLGAVLEGTNFQCFTEKANSARFSSSQDESEQQAAVSGSELVVQQVKLLAADSEQYTSDMFFQCKSSQEITGLNSGIVLAKKEETDPSMSRDLKANSIIEMSSDEGDQEKQVYDRPETPKDIQICDQMADKMSAENKHQRRMREESNSKTDGSVLHSDAEQDMETIRQQLHQFKNNSKEGSAFMREHLDLISSPPLKGLGQDLDEKVIVEQLQELQLFDENGDDSSEECMSGACKDTEMKVPRGRQLALFETSQKNESRPISGIRGENDIQQKTMGFDLMTYSKMPNPVPLTKEELTRQKVEFDKDYYRRMLTKEYTHRLQQDYFQWQTKVNKLMRVTLLCWLDEVCQDMRFQRSTFHMALAYTDKFYEQTQKLYGPDQLQLIGVTAIYMAAKVEEVMVPQVRYFSKATNYSQSVEAICLMEREMLSVLRFRLHPVTLLTWADWYTQQWDSYAEKYNMHELTECKDASFRQFSLESYNRFRGFMQYLDAVAIDFQSHEFQPRELIAALMYLVLGNQDTMMVFPNYYQMAVQFTLTPPILAVDQAQSIFRSDNFASPPIDTTNKKTMHIDRREMKEQMLCPQISFYNDKVFGPFLEEHFQMKLQQIRPAVMYVSKFLALNLELDPPDYSNLGENPEDVKIEEYLGYQTANSQLLNYLDWIVRHEEQQRQLAMQQQRNILKNQDQNSARKREQEQAAAQPKTRQTKSRQSMDGPPQKQTKTKRTPRYAMQPARHIQGRQI